MSEQGPIVHAGDFDGRDIVPVPVCNPAPDTIPLEELDALTDYQSTSRLEYTDDPRSATVLVIRSHHPVRTIEDIRGQVMYVARPGVGLDNVDQHMCAKQGVLVENFRPASAAAVAERIEGFLLDWRGGITESSKLLARARAGARVPKVMPREIEGKRILFMGLGRIGSEVAKRIHDRYPMLGILAHDPDPKVPMIPFGKRVDDLPRALRGSQIISISVPGEAGTVLGREEFRHIQEGVFIINTSRGVTVDLSALAEHLETNNGSCALDVFPNEKSLTDPNFERIRKHPRSIITAHTAGSYPEALHANVQAAVRGVLDFLDSGSVNADDNRDLLTPSFQPVMPKSFCSRLLLTHTPCETIEAHVRAALIQIGERTQTDYFQNNGVLSSQNEHLGLLMVDVRGKDPEKAVALRQAIAERIEVLRSRIAVYGRKLINLSAEEILLHAIFAREPIELPQYATLVDKKRRKKF